MQSKTPFKTYGVAYHSPLDIDSMIKPGRRSISLIPEQDGGFLTQNPLEKADFLYTKAFVEKANVKVQLIFGQHSELKKQNLKILDEGSTSGAKRLTEHHLDHIFENEDPEAHLVPSVAEEKLSSIVAPLVAVAPEPKQETKDILNPPTRRRGRPAKSPHFVSGTIVAANTVAANIVPVVVVKDSPKIEAVAEITRKRGRPAKIVSESTGAIAAANTEAKRGRGRPKKDVNVSHVTKQPIKQVESMEKRGRGRPRKNAILSSTTAATVKKGRGRPKKDASVSKVETTSAVKRGRGRPAKVNVDLVVKTGKRGRPRKTSLIAPTTTTVKRGRPRKTDVAASAPLTAPTAITAKRGRPKKVVEVALPTAYAPTGRVEEKSIKASIAETLQQLQTLIAKL